jgi:hypothetical protein
MSDDRAIGSVDAKQEHETTGAKKPLTMILLVAVLSLLHGSGAHGRLLNAGQFVEPRNG